MPRKVRRWVRQAPVLLTWLCCLVPQGGQSGESRREWATAVLEALRSQNKLPGMAGLGQSGQAEASGQQPGQAGSGEPHLVTCLRNRSETVCCCASRLYLQQHAVLLGAREKVLAFSAGGAGGGAPSSTSSGCKPPTGLSPAFAQLFPGIANAAANGAHVTSPTPSKSGEGSGCSTTQDTPADTINHSSSRCPQPVTAAHAAFHD